MAFNAPEIEQIEEEPPPPPEEEEPPPELERSRPSSRWTSSTSPSTRARVARSPATFAMPTIGTSQRDLGTEDFVDFSDLDQIPRPDRCERIQFPASPAQEEGRSGRVILLVKLESIGEVMDVELDSSSLPDFDRLRAGEVKRWRFTPPTQQGQPVKAKARLPIPINIE